MADKLTKITASTLAEILAYIRNPPGGGDMMRAVYDPDEDGIVEAADSAAQVSDGLNTATAAQVKAAVDAKASWDDEYRCVKLTL